MLPLLEFRKLILLYFAINLCFVCNGVQCVLKPRGVPLSSTFSLFFPFTNGLNLIPRYMKVAWKVFYDASQNFSCLDGSGVFPFYFVNDDFCDCKDGSDEPGTAACPNGVFICLNYGHVSVTIPSSRVNDGICDCCDTTDEYRSVADCFDNCKEQGLQALATAKTVYEEYLKGNVTRQKYISEANIQRENFVSQLNKLLKDESGAMKIKLLKQDLKEKAEENEHLYLGLQKQAKQEQEEQRNMEMKLLQEHKDQDEMNARNAFLELDVNNDGKVTFSEIKSFLRFDYDDDGKVSENEAKFYMHKKEELTLDEFLQFGWRTMKPAFMIEDLASDNDDKIFNSKLSISPLKNSGNKLSSFEGTPKVNEKERSAAFEDAAIKRKEYADAEKALHDIQENIWLLKKRLDVDYGTDSEFFLLQDKCFDFSEKQYLYRVCPFDRAIQIMKHNKDETLLGLWDSWTGSNNKYLQMSYTRGSACWNGPARSVLINFQCGVDNKVLSVVENSPCQYLFELSTPASCKNLPNYVEKILKNHIINL